MGLGAAGLMLLGAGAMGVHDGYLVAGLAFAASGLALVPVGLRGLYRWRTRKKNGHRG